MTYMDNRNWLRPIGAAASAGLQGASQAYSKLGDGPYRSLAGHLRRASGYAKVDILYAEFLWANFLRGRIGVARLREDFAGCVRKALTLAGSSDAARSAGALPAYLPLSCPDEVKHPQLAHEGPLQP